MRNVLQRTQSSYLDADCFAQIINNEEPEGVNTDEDYDQNNACSTSIDVFMCEKNFEQPTT